MQPDGSEGTAGFRAAQQQEMCPQNRRDGAVGGGAWRKALEDSSGSAHGEGTCWSLWDPDEAEAGKEGKFWAYYLHMENA